MTSEHPRHLILDVVVRRERRPTGTTQFGGNVVLHEGTSGFEADLARIGAALHSLVDGVVDRLRKEGWGAWKKGDQTWDGAGPADSTGTTGPDNGG